MLTTAILWFATAWGANTLVVNDASGDPGEAGIVVKVVLNNSDSVAGFQFDFTYDSSVLSLVGTSLGPPVSSWILATSAVSPGVQRVLGFSLSGAVLSSGSSVVTELEFDVLANATNGCSDLTLVGSLLSDPAGNGLTHTVVSGVFTVGSGDVDGDGVAASIDCDNCDASVGAPANWYADTDSDGYGDASNSQTDCYQPTGYVSDSTDCNDGNAASNPGASETCDGIDNDCDLAVDEDSAIDAATWYADTDGDGYGDASNTATSCAAPTGYVTDSTDCDDASALYNPGATETDCADPNDYNCDGTVGAIDSDSDGFYACEECNDTDAAIHPSATEVCDGVDNDCDNTVDLDPGTGAYLGNVYYQDLDGDSYGNASVTVEDCAATAPSGTSSDSTDCDDANASTNPGAAETWYDGVDSDCDGASDYDADGDGFDSAVHGGEDCDDTNSSIHPDAEETWYDGVDDNCDGNDSDQDGDGFDVEADCDDTDPEAWPGSEDWTEDCEAIVHDEEDDTGDEKAEGEKLSFFGCTSLDSRGGATWHLVLLGAALTRRRRR
jgi:hypothetical protein